MCPGPNVARWRATVRWTRASTAAREARALPYGSSARKRRPDLAAAECDRLGHRIVQQPSAISFSSPYAVPRCCPERFRGTPNKKEPLLRAALELRRIRLLVAAAEDQQGSRTDSSESHAGRLGNGVVVHRIRHSSEKHVRRSSRTKRRSDNEQCRFSPV